MAVEQIVGRDGTVTVVSDSYGWGSISTGGPTRQEDSTQYEPRTLSEDEVCRRYKATKEELRLWMAEGQGNLSFPRPHTQSGKGYWTNLGRRFRPSKFFWPEAALDLFDDRIREVYARLK